mmetsp:Transcript_10619/g.22844  ORF Transcript_10619/g.22844 Transcript_10619/m.22844 type:complete len:80 (-) Transcript_10619:173-412(-)
MFSPQMGAPLHGVNSVGGAMDLSQRNMVQPGMGGVQPAQNMMGGQQQQGLFVTPGGNGTSPQGGFHGQFDPNNEGKEAP